MNKSKKFAGKILVIMLLSALPLLLTSCKDAVNSLGNPQVSVSLKSDDFADNSATIVLDSAKGLLEMVRIQGTNTADIKAGPFVMRLMLDGSMSMMGVNAVTGGTYNKVSFKFHKHNPGEPVLDPDFVGTGTVGYSFVIAGKYNDTPFVYKSPKTAIAEVTVDPASYVNPTSVTVYNITLVVNPTGWFVKNGILMDPRDPVNENDIDNNIKDSFKKAFKDDDVNGIPD